ncbi:Beige/BEACH domain containing protein [Trichomonas vaginalis G3]|uniref:Beige/BEACH domain containing protein n=1 Tax=Trichomonas vaginalis (strain ATCC PRA-98 / G3) TaxID=412133 RepID=A2D9Z3_TRIV3|nr:beige/BEACH-related family [Trichomonas vaginalis G3]EAY22641.1 Beige/BEACH domain containing protein [Trichomonas vaginalis G3]KAI5525455.1 beige/BEACH-related family [Trichomonas vaginalis G3]|eukprot:XP_001583627.1 Beige/BEACH domain containing protein [Trichomonas vaginalis G3]
MQKITDFYFISSDFDGEFFSIFKFIPEHIQKNITSPELHRMLSNMLDIYSTSIKVSIIDFIVLEILPGLAEFHPQSIEFFLRVYPLFPESKILREIMVKFAVIISASMTKAGLVNPFDINVKLPQSCTLPPLYSQSTNPQKSTFKKEFNFENYKPNHIDSQIIQVDDLYKSQFSPIAEQLTKMFNISPTNVFDEAAKALFTQVVEPSPFVYDFTGFLLSLFLKTKKFPNNFFNSFIFSDRLTPSINNFEIVHSIRYIILDNYFKQLGARCSDFMKVFEPFPSSFQDVISCLIKIIPTSLTFLHPIAEPLLEVIFKFSVSMVNMAAFDDLAAQCNLFRTNVFLMFHIFISEYDFLTILSENTHLSETICQFLMEDNCRKFIFDEITRILSWKSIKLKDNKLLAAFETRLKVIVMIIKDQHELQQIFNFISSSVRTILQAHPQLTRDFHKIFTIMIESISDLSTNDDHCIENMLDLLLSFNISSIKYGVDVSISDREEMHFSNWILSAYQNHPPPELYLHLMKCLAHDTKLDISKPFEFVNPKVISIMLNSFKYTSLLPEIVQIITKKCDESGYNCNICNKYEIDLAIVSFIEKTRIDPTIPIKEEQPEDATVKNIDPRSVLQLFKLFETISIRTSSYVSALRYISLFSPIANAYLPSYYECALETLENMISSANQQAETAYPFTKYSKISFINLPELLYKSGFKAVLWFLPMRENSAQPVKILTADNSSGQIISFKVDSQHIIITFQSEDKTIEQIEKINFEINKWNLLSVQIQSTPHNSPKNYQVKVSVNNQTEKTVTFPYFPLTKDGLMAWIFADDVDCPDYYLGPFGICLPTADLTNYYKDGPRQFKKNNGIFIIYANPFLINNYLTLDDFAHVKYNSFIVHTIQNLPDIIASHGNVQVLVPLLAQCDMQDQKGKIIEKSFMRSMKIICSVLTLHQNAQIKFENCFSILSFFIQQFPQHQSKELYDLFVDLLDFLHEKSLIESLIKIILTNHNIWFKSDPRLAEYVTEKWSDHIATYHGREIGRVRRFWWFTALLIRYCYRVKEKISLERSEFDVELVRKNIYNTLIKIAKDSWLETKDFEIIAHQILTVKDDEIRKSLLQFTYDLLSKTKNVYKDKEQLIEPLLIIRVLLLKNNIDISILVFMILSEMSISSKVTVFNYYEIIMREIEDEFVPNEELFLKLAELCQTKVPSLLNIVCWMAMQFDKPEFYEILLNFKPSNQYYMHNFNWAVWPVILIHTIKDNKKRLKFMDFLINCTPDGWSTVMYTIVSVSLALDYNMRLLQQIMIKSLANNIDKYPDQQENFEQFVIEYLFFYIQEYRKNQSDDLNYLSPCIQKLFSRSAYVSRNEVKLDGKRKSQSKIIIKRLSQILDSLPNLTTRAVINQPTKNYHLKTVSYQELDNNLNDILTNSIIKTDVNMVFDNDGIWTDYELCQEIFPKIKKYGAIFKILLYRYQIRVGIVKIEQKNQIESLYRVTWNEVNTFFENMNSKNKEYCEVVREFIQTLGDDQERIKEQDQEISPVKLLSKQFPVLLDQLIKRFDEEDSNDVMSQKTLWAKLWHKMTTERAPWFNSIPKQDRIAYFKRDNILCQGIPAKFKRNYHYDVHSLASAMRDSGNKTTAENVVKEAEIAKKFGLKEKAVLLTIQTDENEKDESSESNSLNVYPYHYDCILVTCAHTTLASFNYNNTEFCIQRTGKGIHILPFKEVESIFWRTVFHKRTAIEIFMKNGESYFVNFPEINSINILKDLKNKIPTALVQTTDFPAFFASSGLTQKWINREISNFEYLLAINKYAGRSFNHLSQYPILPWILTDYESNTIDLNDKKIYRDMGKPIGAMNESRLEENRQKMKELEENSPGVGDLFSKPYLYSNGPMAPQTIFVYLIRTEPFCKLHIEHQGEKFDNPDRQFRSVEKVFKLVMNEMNFYSELIPEFFYQPDFLRNYNHFDLGKSEGKDISEVDLPNWANKSPFHFIYTMRKALESEYVSEKLHKWIDLMFGKKQKSLESNNLFLWALYADAWEVSKNDPSMQVYIEQETTHCGQIPQQLFTDFHKPRNKPASHGRMFSFQPTPQQTSSYTVPLFQQNDDSHTIVAGQVIECQNGQFTFAIISKDGTVYITNVTTREIYEDKSKRSPLNAISSDKKYSFDTTKIAACGKSLFVVGTTNREIFEICADAKVNKYAVSPSDILCIASSKKYLITGDIEGVATVYDIPSKSVYCSIDMFRAGITSIAISEEYHMFVCGMSDGCIIICSLNTKSFVRVINLKDCFPGVPDSEIIPRRIVITEGWGFITVFFGGEKERKVCLFTNSGNDEPINSSIKMNKHMTPETSAIAIKDEKGIDYIIQSYGKSILFFEAAELKQNNLIYGEAPDKINNLYYSYQHSFIVAITSSGFHFVPFGSKDL